MSFVPSFPVLLTGAAGKLGKILTKELTALGWKLRLTDLVEIPEADRCGCPFKQCDLGDTAATEALLAFAEGCGAVLHFGGLSTEFPFEQILHSNIIGTHNTYEIARQLKAVFIYASSNHLFGYHKRSDRLARDCLYMPDGEYGVSKAFAESEARLYWYKHNVQSVLIRIGSCCPKPKDARSLSTWFAPSDLVSLVVASIKTMTDKSREKPLGLACVWGASKSSVSFYSEEDDRKLLGWEPKETADQFAEELKDKVTTDPTTEFYQGAGLCSKGRTNPLLI